MNGSRVFTCEKLDVLAEQIANFSLRIDLAAHAMLRYLREFDCQDGWEGSGFVSTATWLAWRIEISSSAAREYVRVAWALGDLHLIDEAFASGKISYSKVRAITRAATAETEQDFLDIAMHTTAAQMERVAAAYRRARVDPAQPNLNMRRFARRSETRSGMARMDIQLPPEQANVVWEAMLAAMDAGRSESESASAEMGASAELRREVDPSVLEAERADALVNVAQAYLQHDQPRTLGSGYELVMLTSPEQLQQAPGGVGGFLRDGTPVPRHIARMLACDCSRVDVTTNESGEILDVGRARRTIPSAIGRALWLRDGGCRVPGCGRKRHLHGHHIEAWADGGETSKSNLVLLCPSHHALVHEGMLFVDVRDGKLEFKNAYGLPIPNVPPRPGDPETIGRWLYEDPHIARFPQWDGSPLDLEYIINSALASHAESPSATITAEPQSRH